MSFINQRYSKAGLAENSNSERVFTEQIYIDGKNNKQIMFYLLRYIFFSKQSVWLCAKPANANKGFQMAQEKGDKGT